MDQSAPAARCRPISVALRGQADIGFTGQRLDATGLMFYQARYYSAVIGRFISADSFIKVISDPQNLNRYAYVYNNPLRYIDPSGRFSEEEIEKFYHVKTWDEVLAFFDKGGILAGRWGWLAILRTAEYGDTLNITWDKSMLPSDHPNVADTFLGKFQKGVDDELLIVGKDYVMDQMKAAMYGKQYKLSTEGRPWDPGKQVAGAFLILAVNVPLEFTEAGLLYTTGPNPLTMGAFEVIDRLIQMPVNVIGVKLMSDGSPIAPKTKLNIPAKLDFWGLMPQKQ
jgi:RHS repeat-associated protein